MQKNIATLYKKLGHTLPSQKEVVRKVIAELENYGKTLGKEDKKIYDEMLEKIYGKVESINYAGSVHVWAFTLITILFEHEKSIKNAYRHNKSSRQTNMLEHTK